MAKRQIPFLLLIAVTVVALAGITVAVPANVPWDKAPEQWTLADVFRILQTDLPFEREHEFSLSKLI